MNLTYEVYTQIAAEVGFNPTPLTPYQIANPNVSPYYTYYEPKEVSPYRIRLTFTGKIGKDTNAIVGSRTDALISIPSNGIIDDMFRVRIKQAIKKIQDTTIYHTNQTIMQMYTLRDEYYQKYIKDGLVQLAPGLFYHNITKPTDTILIHICGYTHNSKETTTLPKLYKKVLGRRKAANDRKRKPK